MKKSNRTMDRYYKTSIDSETGKKVTALLEQRDRFKKKVQWFCEKYDIKSYSYSKFYLCGLQSVVFRSNLMPNGNIWKRTGSEFSLRSKPRDKKFSDEFFAVKKDWDAVLSLCIERNAVDKIFGSKDPFIQCGLSWSNRDWYIVSTDHSESYDMPVDCQEITNIEYATLIKDSDGTQESLF